MAKQQNPKPRQTPPTKPVRIPLKDTPRPKPSIREGSGSGNRPTKKG